MFVLPSFISTPEDNAEIRSSILRVDISIICDVMGCHGSVFIHGKLDVPELGPGDWRRHLNTIGAKCNDVSIILSTSDNKYKIILPMSDSIGRFIFILDSRWVRE